MHKNFLIIFILGIGLLGLFTFLLLGKGNVKSPLTTDRGPTSFEECVAENGMVMTIYPGRCTAKNGKTFVQDIGNEMEKVDIIISENPRPGQKVESPLIIEGMARGNWFFEATFPVSVEDGNGNVIATTFASALDDWMTTEFVQFTATATFDKPETKKGRLILHKANASDLEDQEDSLIVPITFY